MKKAFLLPLLLLGLVGCGNNGGGAKTLAVYDFSSITRKNGQGYADLETINAAFAAFKTKGDASIEITEHVAVYEGTGSSGAKPQTAGILKMGKSDTVGKLVFTVSATVKKIKINCHSFYGKSADYPTNTTNAVKVNGGDYKFLPYNETGDGENIEFAVNGKTITIETINPSDNTKGGRGYFYSFTLLG